MAAPIFVVGTMRSGSTLLRLVLDSHPDIAIGEETGFMGAAATTMQIPNWRYGREWYARLGWTESELDERLRDFYSGMFARHATTQGKQRWGDKTPFHSWHIPAMARIFPDAVFLGIVRHPTAVVRSLKKRFHYGVAEAAEYWESTNVEILRNGTTLGADRFALCRYEDLVVDPERTLREALHWLGEPWSEDVLRHGEVQSAKGAPRIVDGATSSREPISADRVARGSAGLSPEEQAVVRDTAGALAGFLGYDVDDPLRLEPVTGTDAGAAARRLLTGEALEVRRQSWQPPLTFDSRSRAAPAPEMGAEELAERLRQVEATLSRVRSRPVVRFSDAVRRAQRRAAVPRGERLTAAVRRRLDSSRRRHP